MKTFSLAVSGLIAALVLSGQDLRGQSNNAFYLNIAPVNSNALLTWTNTGVVLESSPVLPGSWTEITGAVSPRMISLTNASGFFRLRVNTNLSTSFAFRYVAPTFTASIGDPLGCNCTSPECPHSLDNRGSAQDNALGSVLLHTGETSQDELDSEISGRGLNWQFERIYRSGMNYDGPLGHGWDFNQNRRLTVEANGNVLCMNGLGRADRYVSTGANTFSSPAGFYTQLFRNANGTFTESDRHGTTNTYSATNSFGIAHLTRINDRNNNQMLFQYNPGGQLTNIMDTLARPISFRYDANGRLTNLTDFAGRATVFGYDTNGNLSFVTSPPVTGTPNGNDFPAGKTTRYTYATGTPDPHFDHALLSVTSPNQVAGSAIASLVAQYTSTANGVRIASLTLGGSNIIGGRISYNYSVIGTVSNNDYLTAVFQTTVSNRNGSITQYQFNQLGNIVRIIQYTRGLRIGEPASYTTSFAYNGNGELIGQTNAELDSIQYTYDSSNPSPLRQGNLLQTRWIPGPRGGDQDEVVINKSYTTNFNFVATSTDGRSNTMTFSYDSRGNCTNITHLIPSIVEDFEYNGAGQMTAHTLPDNGSGNRRRDVMTYYSSGPQRGHLQQSVIDSGGFNLVNSYAYDTAGNVVSIVDPRGNDTLYTYNTLNQLVETSQRSINAPSGTVRYKQDTSYDANGNIVRVDVDNRDDSGALVSGNPVLTTTYTYDILNRRLTMTQYLDASNTVTTAYVYDGNDNLILTQFGEAVAGRQTNNVVQTMYDERNLPFRVIRAPGDPAQSTDQYDYDGNGNKTLVSQGLENTPRLTMFAYDGYDRVLTQTDPMGNVITYHYDANGNTISNRVDGELNDVSGSGSNVRLSESTFTYDAMNRLVQTDQAFFDAASQSPIASGHAINQTVYSDNSQVLQTIDANNNSTFISYDTTCRPSVVTDAKTNTTTYAYDANDNIVTMTEVDKSDLGSPDETFVTQYTYDHLDRLTQTVDNIGVTNGCAYDSRNNQVQTTDGRDNVSRYAYDGLNRLTSTTSYLTDTDLGSGTPVGTIVTAQSWDATSRLTGQTDANSNTTVYVYDPLNRMTQTIFANGTSDTLVFDVHNNTVTESDANGNVVSGTYDLLDRVLAKTVSRGPGIAGTTFENYQYDGLSRAISSANDDSTVTRNYDSLSDITLETQHATDGNFENISRTYDANGNNLTLGYPGGTVVTATYDPLDRKLAVSDFSASATYNYFGPARVERRDYGNGIRATYAYDAVRRLTNSLQSTPFNSLVVDSRAYAWDATDNKIEEDDLLNPTLDTRSFTYDSVNRLVSSTNANIGPTNIYTIDGAGNWLNVSGGTNGGTYTSISTIPPADYQMNQYTTTPFNAQVYDGNGNLTNAGTEVLTYDYRDELIAVTRYNGAGSYTNVLSAKYDCFGRRIEKSNSDGLTRYLYADWQEIEEQNIADSTIATYMWGNDIDELLNMNRLGQTYYLHADDQGSIRELTFTSPILGEQYRYDDYGKPRFFDSNGNEIAGSQYGNPMLFNGRRFDPETQLSYYRTRYLDHAVGRFITRDTAGIWADGLNGGNGYTYVGNNPMTMNDPSGEAASINTTRSNLKDKASIYTPPRPVGPGPRAQSSKNYGSAKSNTSLAAAGDGIGGVDIGLKKKPGGQLLVAAPINTNPTSEASRNFSSAKSNTSIFVAGDGSGDGDNGANCAASINTTRSNLKDKASITVGSTPVVKAGPPGPDPRAEANRSYSSAKSNTSIFVADNGSGGGGNGANCAASINTTRSNLKDKASISVTGTPVVAVHPSGPNPNNAASRTFNSVKSNTSIILVPVNEFDGSSGPTSAGY